MRRARERRQIALDLWRELDEPLPEFSASILLDEPPADAARRIREWVGIPMDEQLRWSNQHAALKAWRSALEARGILVLQFTDVPIREARGFSFSEQPLPVIAVNSKDLAVARIFTMFHELVHLLLRQSGVCDYVGGSRISDAVLLERHCNAVAAEILVPSDALAVADRGVLEFDDVHRRIAEIARRFKVSKEATVLRLIAAGRASWAIWDEVHGRHFREVEENVQKLREHDGGPSPTTRAMANLGSRFLSLLVRAYQAELITGPEFVDYANVRLKRIDEIEGALVRGQ
jgi:Zn-dependent peptidase ImmA (M78 family)